MAGEIVTVGLALDNVVKGDATIVDYADLTIGGASIGATVFLASNPIGWAITFGATIYFTARLGYDLYMEINEYNEKPK